MRRILLLLAFAALTAVASMPPALSAVTDAATGFVVVTPDRGFLGNEEVSDAFDQFAQGRNARLVFVTDGRSRAVLDAALDALAKQGATRVAVLPLVVSAPDARWQLARGWLEARRAAGRRIAIAPVYGASYLAVEDLSARLRAAHTDKMKLVLVGHGASDANAAQAMARDLVRIGRHASTLDADSIRAVVYPANHASDAANLRQQAQGALRVAHGALVVPLAFAPRDDSMMAFPNWYADLLPTDAQALAGPLAGTDALAQWMTRAANAASLRLQPAGSGDIGVIVLAHGADWFWNRELRQSLAPVTRSHKVAFAFSMADPVVVERAVRKLEAEHVRAIVLVRAFGMASSFRAATQHMIGADVDAPGQGGAHAPVAHHGMAMGGSMGPHHASLAAAARIRSSVPIVTVGGVDADPLFARALLAQARALSRDPARETVIIVAHGQGDAAANRRWIDLLENLAHQMQADGGTAFRAIRVATWREDWPDERKAAVAKVRAMVAAANRDGGRTLLIPARINDRGAADRYLAGLPFAWGTGFAQTPFFTQWVEQEIRRGVAQLRAPAPAPVIDIGVR